MHAIRKGKDNAKYHLRTYAQYELTVTHFLVSADIKKAVELYSRILRGKVVMDGESGKANVVQLANTRVVIKE